MTFLEEIPTEEVISMFKRKNDVIQELLRRAGMGFKEEMAEEQREALDVERQKLVLRAGWNNMTVQELEALLGPLTTSIDEIERLMEKGEKVELKPDGSMAVDRADFRTQLENLINSILAQYLVDVLEAFDKAVRKREGKG
jgi:hypothetical protein